MLEALAAHVADDPNDCRRRAGLVAAAELPADRILAGPEVPGERVVDDCDPLRAVHVALGKQAAATQPDAERFEGASRDGIAADGFRRVGRAPVDSNAVVRIAALQDIFDES